MSLNVVNARVTFRNSPIHMLERFTFRDMGSAYSAFLEHSGLRECVILQTCNRVEIFGAGNNHDVDRIKKTWASIAGLEENAFKENLEVSEGHDVYEHLLKLTAGLDSLVVGEEQILGQIKNSITTARKVKACGQLQKMLIYIMTFTYFQVFFEGIFLKACYRCPCLFYSINIMIISCSKDLNAVTCLKYDTLTQSRVLQKGRVGRTHVPEGESFKHVDWGITKSNSGVDYIKAHFKSPNIFITRFCAFLKFPSFINCF